MAKNKRCVFLPDKFYTEYSQEIFPELEQKIVRPYIQVYIEINEIHFAIPLRSGKEFDAF